MGAIWLLWVPSVVAPSCWVLSMPPWSGYPVFIPLRDVISGVARTCTSAYLGVRTSIGAIGHWWGWRGYKREFIYIVVLPWPIRWKGEIYPYDSTIKVTDIFCIWLKGNFLIQCVVLIKGCRYVINSFVFLQRRMSIWQSVPVRYINIVSFQIWPCFWDPHHLSAIKDPLVSDIPVGRILSAILG